MYRTLIASALALIPGMVALADERTAEDSCAVTQPVRDAPPPDPRAAPFPFALWYVNSDRTLWAGWDAAHLRAGTRGNKILWIRPKGTDLQFSARRLDGDSEPAKISIPCCYRSGFQSSGITFATPGCWEISAKAGDSELRFVTRVRPST